MRKRHGGFSPLQRKILLLLLGENPPKGFAELTVALHPELRGIPVVSTTRHYQPTRKAVLSLLDMGLGLAWVSPPFIDEKDRPFLGMLMGRFATFPEFREFLEQWMEAGTPARTGQGQNRLGEKERKQGRANVLSARMTGGDEQCQHYWCIDSPNGPLSLGTCRKCGGTKEFSNSMEMPWSFAGPKARGEGASIA